MKKHGAALAMLTPTADGWKLWNASGTAQTFATLADASVALTPGTPVHLALPCHELVIEGLRLPTTERAELASMVRLQLEKSLPYPLDEVSADFVVVNTLKKESAVVSLAVSHASLERLCQPLRSRGLLPERITPFVLHVAAACPAAGTVLAIYPEQGELVLAICTGGQLAWAHIVTGTDAARLASELPQALLAAAMEGAPADFTRVLLAPEARALSPVIGAALAAPIETLPAAAPDLAGSLNLVPLSWRNAAQQQIRTQRIRGRLKAIGAGYFCVLVAGLTYWFLLNREAAELAVRVAAAQPKLQLIQARQARSNALAAAVDPSRSAVELLYLVQRALPGDSTLITEFDQQPDLWRVVGEAPNATQAIDYITRLKADPDLSTYQITAGPPQLLPNEHAQFNIFGKR